MREFHDAPSSNEMTSELKDRTLKLTLLSHRAQTLPYLTLSGQFIMQSVGTSDWLLAPPTEAQKFHPYPLLHPLALQTQLEDSHLSSSGLHGIDLNSDILTEGAGEWVNQGAEIESISVDYIRLVPGQLLFIPPYWTAQSMASATSVTLSTSDLDSTDIEARLKAIRDDPRFSKISDIISDVMKREARKESNQNEEMQSEALGEVDPEVWLREKILSLIRILKTSLHGHDWYSGLFDSYETFHNQIAATKADFAHRVVGKACSIGEITSEGKSLSLDSKIRAALAQVEAELSTSLSNTLEVSTEPKIASGLIAESAIYAVLHEADVMHSFLHECQKLWSN